MEAARLSDETELRIALLFPPEQQGEVRRLIVEECSNNLPFLKDYDPARLERFRFAALKLSDGNIDKLHRAT